MRKHSINISIPASFDLLLDEMPEPHARAMRSLGGCYYEGRGVEQNYSKAIEWYKRGAEKETAGRNFSEVLELIKLEVDNINQWVYVEEPGETSGYYIKLNK